MRSFKLYTYDSQTGIQRPVKKTRCSRLRHLYSVKFLMKCLRLRWNQIFCSFFLFFLLASAWGSLKTASPWERPLVDMKEAIVVTFAEKQRLTNERRWQGCGEVLAERNTFVSRWSSERPVRHREMTSSQPQGALLPVLAHWQIDQTGQVWLNVLTRLRCVEHL